MSLKTRKKIKRFTKIQEARYEARKEICEEKSRLEKRLKDLKKDRDKIDSKLAPLFEQNGNMMKMSDGTIVERKIIDIDDQICTKEQVGTVLRSGYSYPNYSEIAGNT